MSQKDGLTNGGSSTILVESSVHAQVFSEYIRYVALKILKTCKMSSVLPHKQHISREICTYRLFILVPNKFSCTLKKRGPLFGTYSEMPKKINEIFLVLQMGQNTQAVKVLLSLNNLLFVETRYVAQFT